MAKRYVAARDGLPWGKRHLNAGDELVDPNPNDAGPDILVTKVLVPTQQVREMTAAEAKRRAGAEPEPVANAGTYSRRDMVAGEQKPARTQRRAEKPAGEGGAVGAMTTKPQEPEAEPQRPEETSSTDGAE